MDKKKVLVVDDNNINRRIMGQLLRGMQIDVKEAKDGYEAIEIVKNEDFDLVFMDIFMPGIDGYETSKQLRSLDGSKGSIPIIAVSAEELNSTDTKIIECGINGVLRKPFKKENLEELLNENFTSNLSKVLTQNDSLSVFNKADFELLYEDIVFRKEILSTFFNDQQNDLDRISKAFEEGSSESIHDALHYMKGSFTFLKAERILCLTRKIMELVDENKLNEALLLKQKLFINYDLLFKELQSYQSTL